MQPELYVVSIGGKHYVSGTIYTPNGVKPYINILDSFEEIFTLLPTFATRVSCYYDDICKRDHIDYFYYLTYRNEDELIKMLTFMSGESVSYLQYIPEEVLKKLDIHIGFNYFRIGGANILQSVECKVIGSIPTLLTITRDYIAINGVVIGTRNESGNYNVCGEEVDLANGVIGSLSYLLACYFLKHYKGTPTWSEVLKTWCGIRIS